MNKRALIEQEVVAGLLARPEKLPEVCQLIGIEDFLFYGRHFQIIFDSWRDNKNVMAELIGKGIKPEEYADLLAVFSARPITFAAKELREQSSAYKIKNILGRAAEEIPSENIDQFVADIQQQIIKSVEGYNQEQSDAESLIKEFEDYQEVYRKKKANGGKILGIPTGYDKIDDLIDGLRPEHLWVIGGYSSTGKTFTALNITANIMQQGYRTVFYSLEMSRVDILARVLGIISQENGSSISKDYISRSSYQSALDMALRTNFTVHSEKHDISQILLSMYEETVKQKVDLFVVDFLQLVKVKNARTEYETTTTAILELQKAAKRFKVPIIVLSQVSNESARAGGDSIVMGFKGSGGIAAAADFAIELTSGEDSIKTYREKLNEGHPVCVKWQIRKNRHGRVGFIEMEFTGKTGRFEILTEEKKNDF